MIPDSCSRSATRYVPYAATTEIATSIRWSSASASAARRPSPRRAPITVLATIVTTNETAPSASVTGCDTAVSAIANSTTPVPSLSRLSDSTTVERRRRRAEPLEQRDDGDRVGGREHRAEDERGAEREAGQARHDERDDRRGDQHARRREDRDDRERAPELADVDLVGRLEHEPGSRTARISSGVMSMSTPGHGDRERQAGEDEGDGVGDGDPARDQRHAGRDREQQDEQLDGEQPGRFGRRHRARAASTRARRRPGRHGRCYRVVSRATLSPNGRHGGGRWISA